MGSPFARSTVQLVSGDNYGRTGAGLMSKASINLMVKYFGMTVGWALYTVLLPVRMEPTGGISIASEMYSDLPWKTVWFIVGCVST